MECDAAENTLCPCCGEQISAANPRLGELCLACAQPCRKCNKLTDGIDPAREFDLVPLCAGCLAGREAAQKEEDDAAHAAACAGRAALDAACDALDDRLADRGWRHDGWNGRGGFRTSRYATFRRGEFAFEARVADHHQPPGGSWWGEDDGERREFAGLEILLEN